MTTEQRDEGHQKPDDKDQQQQPKQPNADADPLGSGGPGFILAKEFS